MQVTQGVTSLCCSEEEMRSVSSSVPYTLDALTPATSPAWEGLWKAWAQDADRTAADVRGSPGTPRPTRSPEICAVCCPRHTPGRQGLDSVQAVAEGERGGFPADTGGISTKFASPWPAGEAGEPHDCPHEEI